MGAGSVNRLLEDSFRKNWDREALSNYQGVTLKYSDVARRIAHLHLNFRQCGLCKGDKVALCSRNQANWGVCFLAALTYGAVPVPILHEFKPGNIHYLVSHSDAKVLFVDDVIWEGLSETEMPGLYVVVQMNTLKYLYSRDENLSEVRDDLPKTFLREYPGGFGPDDIHYYEDKPDELAVINYTSGTSGFSKGVMLPYRALMANIRFAGTGAEPQMNENSKVVAMLPSAHMYGLMFEFLFEMTIGAHVYFLTRLPSPKVIVSALKDIKPDIIISVPLVLEKIYKTNLKPAIDRNRTFLRIPVANTLAYRKIKDELYNSLGGNFEEIILGGAPFNPKVEKLLHRIHFPFTVGYGMTECAPLITYSKWNKSKLTSCGCPITGCSIRIDSPDGKNIPGEIQIKGDNVFIGYYKNEEATARAFTEDGWFRTGDMGVIDADGFLFLRGRSKCMILGPSGQNIYPEELEAVINNMSYVVESLVIEDEGGLTALIYPDYHQADLDGMSREALEDKLKSLMPALNDQFPKYAQLRKMDFLPEDFERTPKRSIKRYLYQRNNGKV